ncbi:MAG: hypothetical protein SXV54_27030 [Chloroflexota bacterium]|nr:hypothetical protein [Chloroflexota bacterium]
MDIPPTIAALGWIWPMHLVCLAAIPVMASLVLGAYRHDGVAARWEGRPAGRLIPDVVVVAVRGVHPHVEVEDVGVLDPDRQLPQGHVYRATGGICVNLGWRDRTGRTASGLRYPRLR